MYEVLCRRFHNTEIYTFVIEQKYCNIIHVLVNPTMCDGLSNPIQTFISSFEKSLRFPTFALMSKCQGLIKIPDRLTVSAVLH